MCYILSKEHVETLKNDPRQRYISGVWGYQHIYKTDIYTIRCGIYKYYYELVYPIGIHIFPIPYWLFPIRLFSDPQGRLCL